MPAQSHGFWQSNNIPDERYWGSDMLFEENLNEAIYTNNQEQWDNYSHNYNHHYSHGIVDDYLGYDQSSYPDAFEPMDNSIRLNENLPLYEQIQWTTSMEQPLGLLPAREMSQEHADLSGDVDESMSNNSSPETHTSVCYGTVSNVQGAIAFPTNLTGAVA